MLKLMLLELLKSYDTSVTTPHKGKKHYNNYFVGFFAISALIFLLLADYVYLTNKFEYIIYMNSLLMFSTILFLLALIIKLFFFWLELKKKQKGLLVADKLSNTIAEVLPIMAGIIPVGIITYLIGVKIKRKFAEKR